MVPKLRFGRGRPAAKNGRPSAPVVGVGMFTSRVAIEVRAARPGVADRRDDVRRAARAAALTFHTCSRGRLQVPLHRPNRVADAAVERRRRERRVGNDEARRRRRVGHRHDQVLLHGRAEVQTVAAADRRRAVAERIPGGADARRQIRPGRDRRTGGRPSARDRSDSPAPSRARRVSIGIVVVS